MTEALEDCLTCRRKTDNFLRISDEYESQPSIAVEDIGDIIASHFWFQANQYEDRVVCTSCWEKIDDFHKFYCEVKQIWDQDVSFGSTTGIKKESPFEEDRLQPDLFVASNLVKIEIVPNNDGDDSLKEAEGDSTYEDQVPDESDTVDDSDDSNEESSVPIAKRCRRGKGETIALKIEKRTRQKRSRNSNGQPIKQTKDASPFQCYLCNPARGFRKEEGLLMHQVICHSDETEKTFQCDQCEKAFASEWQLSGHKRWHETMGLNIRCDICNKYFDSGRSLKYHIQANHTESKTAVSSLIETIGNTNAADQIPSMSVGMAEHSSQMPKSGSYERRLLTPEEHAQQDELIKNFCTLVCDRCGFAGENFYDLEKHCKHVHSVRGYASCCGRRFYKKRLLFEHCQWHTDPDTFRCESCKKSFPDSEALEKHNQWIHMPDSEKPFKCEICDSVFYKEYLLKTHMKYHLSIEKKIYFCNDCDRSFGAPSYLRTHLQAMHGAASSWVCDICAKGFSHKSLLETHRLTHTKEGAASLKRQCEYCHKWLKNAKSISRHLKRCLAGGPVTCELCGKEVANTVALASHKRFNHTEQPVYPCSYCGKIFKRIIRHREHEANHRGEVLYSCPFCPYTCNSNSNMYTHKKTAHTEQWTARIAERFHKR